MNFEEYADFVTKMASEKSMATFESKLGTAAMGLSGEAGEIIDLAKKIFYHNFPYTDEVRQKLILETSDLCWYLAFMLKNVLHIELQEVLDANVEKLNKRYQSGKFTTEEFLKKEHAKS